METLLGRLRCNVEKEQIKRWSRGCTREGEDEEGEVVG
jgi:hypothetical protein